MPADDIFAILYGPIGGGWPDFRSWIVVLMVLGILATPWLMLAVFVDAVFGKDPNRKGA